MLAPRRSQRCSGVIMQNKAFDGARRIEAWRKMLERIRKKQIGPGDPIDTVADSVSADPVPARLFDILGLDKTRSSHRTFGFAVFCDVSAVIDNVRGRPQGSRKWTPLMLLTLGGIAAVIDEVTPDLSDTKLATVVQNLATLLGHLTVDPSDREASIMKMAAEWRNVDVETLRKRLPQARRAWSKSKASRQPGIGYASLRNAIGSLAPTKSCPDN
jgi:hypothetical protein